MAEVTVTLQCECILYHWTVHLNVVKMVNFVLCVFYHNKKRKKLAHNQKKKKKEEKQVGIKYWEGPLRSLYAAHSIFR